jgi:hypothetical protein
VNAPSSAVVGLAPHATKMDVVLDVEPLARASDSVARIDGGQLARCEPRAGGAPELGKLEHMDSAGVERLRDCKRSIPKVVLGREELEFDPVFREGTESELVSSGHAAAGDQNSKRVCLA